MTSSWLHSYRFDRAWFSAKMHGNVAISFTGTCIELCIAIVGLTSMAGGINFTCAQFNFYLLL